MLPRPLPLDPSQILVDTRMLATRWHVDPVTVRRLCRIHEVTEIRWTDHGRLRYPRDEIEALEKDLFHWN